MTRPPAPRTAPRPAPPEPRAASEDARAAALEKAAAVASLADIFRSSGASDFESVNMQGNNAMSNVKSNVEMNCTNLLQDEQNENVSRKDGLENAAKNGSTNEIKSHPHGAKVEGSSDDNYKSEHNVRDIAISSSSSSSPVSAEGALDGGEYASLVSGVVSSLADVEAVHVLALAVACEENFKGRVAVVVLAEALRQDLDAFVLGTLQGLIIARRPSTLSILAVPLATIILDDVVPGSTVAKDRRAILELLLLGSGGTLEVLAKLGSHIERAGPELADLVAGAHWALAHACATTAELDHPFGNASKRESIMRQSAWVHNGAARPMQIPKRPGNDHFAFTYPYFAWPEGTWKLDPSAGQGDRPCFSLYAHNRASGTAINGCLLEPESSSPLVINGIFACSYGSSGSTLYASIRNGQETSDSSTTSQKNPYPLHVDFWSTKELRGWRAKGSDKAILLGVPRSVQANINIDAINDSQADRSLSTVQLGPGQSLRLSKGSLSGSDGWAVQCWIFHKFKDLSQWTEVMRIGHLSIRLKEEPSELRITVADTTARIDLLSGSYASNDSKWLQLVVFGHSVDGLGLAVNGDRVFENCSHDSCCFLTLDAPELCSGQVLYSFLKVWKRSIDVATIVAEYQRGFYSALSIDEAETLLAFCPLQGEGATTLCDVSGNNRHLTVICSGKSLELTNVQVECPEEDEGLPSMMPMFSSHSQKQLFSIGSINGSRELSSVSLGANASLWTRTRIPIAGGARIQVKLRLRSGSKVCVVLHAGSYWDALGLTYRRCSKFSRQVRLFLSLETVQAHGTQYRVMIQVAHPSIRTLIHLPCVGFTPNPDVIQNGYLDIALGIEYRKDEELSLCVDGKSLATLSVNLPDLLRLTELDGVMIGVMADLQPVEVMQVSAEADEDQRAETRVLPWEITCKAQATANSTSSSSTEVEVIEDPAQSAGEISAAATNKLTREWNCSSCTFLNAPESTHCQVCQHPNASSTGPTFQANNASTASVVAKNDQSWSCPQCTLSNPPEKTVCEACDAPRPAAAAPPTIQNVSSDAHANDSTSTWECTACTYRNSGSDSTCTVCGTRRPIGVESAGNGFTSASLSGGSTAAAATAPTQSAAESQAEADLLKLAIGARRENLDALIQAELVQMASCASAVSSESADVPALEKVGNWDTTLGILDIEPTAGEEDRLVFEMKGEYGEDQGKLNVVAYVDASSGSWCIYGSWLAKKIGRNGPHYIDLRLNDSGERLSGTWTHGDTASGTWNAKLEADADQFRGLIQRLREVSMVTSLKEMALRDAREVQIKVTDDQINFPFSPFASGLHNMEQGLYNVCYQNSLLQALFATSALRRSLIFPPEGTVTNNALVNALRELFSRLLLSQRPVFASKNLQKALSQDWRTGEQMDVSDFHNYVFSQLEDAFPNSMLDKLFGYNVAQVRRCASCGAAKIMDEAGRSLAVTLPRQFMPITDIIAVSCSSKSKLHELRVPEGYELVRTNLNAEKDGAPCVFLCVRRDMNASPVTELLVRVVPGTDPAPNPPDGYRSVGVNLNPEPEAFAPTPAEAAASAAERRASGTTTSSPPSISPSSSEKHDQVHLFFQCDTRGSPITDIQVLVGAEAIASPPDDARVISTDLNPSWAARSVVSAIPISNTGASTASPAVVASSGTTSVSAGPMTTPVKLCYMRGMPITDIVISTSPLTNRSADYQVLDKPLNLALDPAHDTPGEIFLWFSDSRVFEKPITDLILVKKSEQHEYEGYELCGDYIFKGGRILMKRRGEGTPITQLSVFRAPRVVPPYRFNTVLDLLSSENSTSASNVTHLRWLFEKIWLPRSELNGGKNSSGTGSSSSSSKQDAVVPPGLQVSRGKALQLKCVEEDAVAVFFHGSFSEFGSEKRAGTLHGTLHYLHKTGNWSFLGYACPANSKLVHAVSFSLHEQSSHVSISGHAVDSSNSTNNIAPVDVKLEGKRVSESTANVKGPVVDLCVFREGDPLPHGFERVASLDDPRRADIRQGMGIRSTYLAARHSVSPDDDPIVAVGFFFPELEGLPTEYSTIMQTSSGEDANLNLGTGAAQMFVAYKRRSSVKTTNVIHRLALQWRDLGDKIPPGFAAINRSVSEQMEANLCLAGTHNIFLCVEKRDASVSVHEHRMNGLYQTSWGDMQLYAVSDERSAILATGGFNAMSSLTKGNDPTVLSLVIVPLRADEGQDWAEGLLPSWTREAAKRRRPAGKPAPKADWLMCGSWVKTDAYGADHLKIVPTVWRGRCDKSYQELLASWAWGKESGVVQLIQDSYVQLAIAKDSSELWRDGEKLFSDRRADSSIQSLVHHYFSSAVLDGADMLMCDQEGQKHLHEQSTLMTSPPEHLILTVKRMGFDFEANRAIKHLQSTPFDPELALPCGSGAYTKPEEIENVLYGLYAVLVHTGANANSGHYFAYTRDSSDPSLTQRDSPTSPWRLLNDAKVMPVDWSIMTSQIEQSESNTVYLLFYKRLDNLGTDNGPGDHVAKKARTKEEASLYTPMEIDEDITAPKDPHSDSLERVLRSFHGRTMPDILSRVLHENAQFLYVDLESRTSRFYTNCLKSMLE